MFVSIFLSAANDFDQLIRACHGVQGLSDALQGLEKVGAKYRTWDELLPAVTEVRREGFFVTASVRAELDAWLASDASPFTINGIKLTSCSREDWESMMITCVGRDALLFVLARLAAGDVTIESTSDLVNLVTEEQAVVTAEQGLTASEHEERMDAAREGIMSYLASDNCFLFADIDLADAEFSGDELDNLLQLAHPFTPDEAVANPDAPQTQLTATLAHFAAFDRVQRRFGSFAELIRAMESACPPGAKSTADFTSPAETTDSGENALIFNLDAVNLLRSHITIAARDHVVAFLTNSNCMLLADPATALAEVRPDLWDQLIGLLLQAHPNADEYGNLTGGLDGVDRSGLTHHLRRLERRGATNYGSIGELIAALDDLISGTSKGAHKIPDAFKASLADLLMDEERCQLFGIGSKPVISSDDSHIEDLIWAILGAKDVQQLSQSPEEHSESALARLAASISQTSALVTAGTKKPCRNIEDAFALLTGRSIPGGVTNAQSRPQTAFQSSRETQDAIRAALNNSTLFSLFLLAPIIGERDVIALSKKESSFANNMVGAPQGIIPALEALDHAGRKLESLAELISACEGLLADACPLSLEVRSQVDELVLAVCPVRPVGLEYGSLLHACDYRPQASLALLRREQRRFDRVTDLIQHLATSEPASAKEEEEWTKWLQASGRGGRLFGPKAEKRFSHIQLGRLMRAAGGDIEALIQEARSFLAVDTSFATEEDQFGALLEALQRAGKEGYHVSTSNRSAIVHALLKTKLFLPDEVSSLTFPVGILDDMVRAVNGDLNLLVSRLNYIAVSGRRFSKLDSAFVDVIRIVSSWTPIAPSEKALVVSYLVSDHCHLWDAKLEAAKLASEPVNDDLAIEDEELEVCKQNTITHISHTNIGLNYLVILDCLSLSL